MNNITMWVREPDSPDDIEFALNPAKKEIIMRGEHLFSQMEGSFIYKFFLLEIEGMAYVNVTDVAFTSVLLLTT